MPILLIWILGASLSFSPSVSALEIDPGPYALSCVAIDCDCDHAGIFDSGGLFGGAQRGEGDACRGQQENLRLDCYRLAREGTPVSCDSVRPHGPAAYPLISAPQTREQALERVQAILRRLRELQGEGAHQGQFLGYISELHRYGDLLPGLERSTKAMFDSALAMDAIGRHRMVVERVEAMQKSTEKVVADECLACDEQPEDDLPPQLERELAALSGHLILRTIQRVREKWQGVGDAVEIGSLESDAEAWFIWSQTQETDRPEGELRDFIQLAREVLYRVQVAWFEVYEKQRKREMEEASSWITDSDLEAAQVERSQFESYYSKLQLTHYNALYVDIDILLLLRAIADDRSPVSDDVDKVIPYVNERIEKYRPKWAWTSPPAKAFFPALGAISPDSSELVDFFRESAP